MNSYSRSLGMILLVLSMPLMLSLTSGRASAQVASRTVFEAPLLHYVNDQPIRKGTVLATLDGDALRLFGAFHGLSNPWVQIDLYRGGPGDAGEFVENLALFLPGPFALGGGFDRTVTLTPDHVEDLHNGLFYVLVRMVTADPKDDLRGQIQLMPAAEPQFLETPLSHLFQGWPVALGSVLAVATDDGLRLLGFFHGLASDLYQIVLYRGAYGTEGEHVTSILIFNGPGIPGLYAGFDHTLVLEEGWEQDLLDGLFSVEVQTSRESDWLRGQILPATNQAPAAAQMLSPVDGETVFIGGTGGAGPVDPDADLVVIAFSEADDPDDNPVGYLWQASLRPDFSRPDQTITFRLGVDSTRIPLTVGGAAALFDGLSGREPGNILLDTPVTLYHRVLTTDGSRYTIGEAVQATFVRGTITAGESAGEVPGRFTLHGNYPNPFNPSTTILFDLPSQADVRVEVFDVLGRQVLTVPAGVLAPGARRTVAIDGAGLSSGSYLYRVIVQGENEAQIATGGMMLVK